ncbi:hypothetical protein, partial [Paraburkholderia mimosarum]|uniref:hypothetical protein n=1 Tax=Paraburkholderia mimosarum TaxID=312026 RepID=UPI001ABB962A
AGERMQDLGQRGVHAFAHACREDHDVHCIGERMGNEAADFSMRGMPDTPAGRAAKSSINTLLQRLFKTVRRKAKRSDAGSERFRQTAAAALKCRRMG